MQPTLIQMQERLKRFEALMTRKYGKEYSRRYLIVEQEQHQNLCQAVADRRASLYAQYQQPYTGPDADVTGVTAADLLNSSQSPSTK